MLRFRRWEPILRLLWHGQTTQYSTAEQSTAQLTMTMKLHCKKSLTKHPSMASKDYGKPFLQIFREADKDFYKIDHGLFAPAVLMINNAKTGKTFKAGKLTLRCWLRILRFLNFFIFALDFYSSIGYMQTF